MRRGFEACGAGPPEAVGGAGPGGAKQIITVITSEADCSQNIKTGLLLARKVMIKPDIVLKRKDITLPTKVPILKAMVLAVVRDLRVGP